GLSFEDQLAGAIRESLVKAGLAPGEVRVTQAAGQSPETGARQILVSVTTPATAGGADAGGAQIAHVVQANQSVEEAADPVGVLKAALKQTGLDPEAFSFTEVRELVSYPGGAYVNHQILFQGGAAHEYYDVALMLRNPDVTVTEIRRLLASNVGTRA
ncbi:MAG: hypothetical protein ACP5U2_13005, partial [Bryobacteraceae bacterium]